MVMAQPFGDVVVVIPGILGSRLVRREGVRETTVWNFSLKNLPRLLLEVVRNGLTLRGSEGPPDDGIEAVELFRYQLLPGFLGVDDYEPLVASLRATVTDPRQLLSFPYDWRASNRFAAERLQQRALEALKTWRDASGNRDAKLWLIGHSMGGLVARYFCEELGGAEDTRAIITIGTPHRGSIKALDALVNGKQVGFLSLTSLVRSLPSVYELLPLFPAVRLQSDRAFSLHRVADFFGLDPVTGEDVPSPPGGWPPDRLAPLPGMDRQMLKRALEFHAKIRGPAEARAARGEPGPYRQEAFFNRRQVTPLSASLEGQSLEVINSYPYERNGVIEQEASRGDGTVPAFSSVPIEWVDSAAAVAVADKHAAMQTGAALRDTIFNWLRPMDVRSKKGGSVSDDDVVELNLPSTLSSEEDLVVQVASLRRMPVTIELEDVDSGAKKTQPLLLPGDSVCVAATFRRPRPGVHRVTAVPIDRMLPTVSDYVCVIGPEGD
jgi:pimeloyl-ACP methyl ester carboxylesterase